MQVCVPNVCPCSRGKEFAAVGPACVKAGKVWNDRPNTDVDVCTRCPRGSSWKQTLAAKGITPESGDCKANTCTCAHGTAVAGKLCLYSGMERCKACTGPGYSLNPATNLCQKKVCTCKTGGPPKIGKDCPKHGQEGCAIATDNPPSQGECTCPKGSPKKTPKCDTPGAELCKSCDAGYTLVGKGCVLKVCTCLTGDPASGKDCPNNKDQKCVKCPQAGYTDLKGGKCLPVCTCDNGDPVRGDPVTGLDRKWPIYRKGPQNPHRIFVVRVSLLTQLVVVCWRYVSSRTWDTRRGVYPPNRCVMGTTEWKRAGG